MKKNLNVEIRGENMKRSSNCQAGHSNDEHEQLSSILGENRSIKAQENNKIHTTVEIGEFRLKAQENNKIHTTVEIGEFGFQGGTISPAELKKLRRCGSFDLSGPIIYKRL
jgi:hypothetical protein